MTDRSVTHSTFVIERVYDASPDRVFAACSRPEEKARWFGGPDDWESSGYELDCRVGGVERVSGGPQGGPVHRYEARFYDVVPDERIVSAYEMYLDDARISVSVATMELRPEGEGTRFVYTEQGVFLDGYDDAGAREHGTRELLDALGASLRREPAQA
jgi:uncharacterized protein YndB with AHSA1/START domain